MDLLWKEMLCRPTSPLLVSIGWMKSKRAWTRPYSTCKSHSSQFSLKTENVSCWIHRKEILKVLKACLEGSDQPLSSYSVSMSSRSGWKVHNQVTSPKTGGNQLGSLTHSNSCPTPCIVLIPHLRWFNSPPEIWRGGQSALLFQFIVTSSPSS